MAKLTQDTRGTYGARKRLPDDVREDYGRLYGARYEAKFSAPAKTPRTVATQLYGEWLSEIEGRFAAIRSQRKGEGVSLTPRQARALAGEWYDWFVARHPVSDQQKWEDLRDKVHEVLRDAIGDQEWERNNPDDLWRDNEDLRKAVRPVLADVGETAQFLGMKGIALDNEARARFLDHLYEDLSAAFKRLIGISKGDYSPDEYRRRFPKFEVSDNGQPPLQLFETWVKERKPALSSIETWRYVFRAMEDHFKDRSASSITPDEAQQWIRGLVTEARSARTVRKNWLTAAKTIFGWAAKEKRVRYNPFQSVTLTIPKRIRLRETQAFLDDERKLILKSALMITDTESPDNAARRWVPWLCAYTGARSGEITQLACTRFG